MVVGLGPQWMTILDERDEATKVAVKAGRGPRETGSRVVPLTSGRSVQWTDRTHWGRIDNLGALEKLPAIQEEAALGRPG